MRPAPAAAPPTARDNKAAVSPSLPSRPPLPGAPPPRRRGAISPLSGGRTTGRVARHALVGPREGRSSDEERRKEGRAAFASHLMPVMPSTEAEAKSERGERGGRPREKKERLLRRLLPRLIFLKNREKRALSLSTSLLLSHETTNAHAAALHARPSEAVGLRARCGDESPRTTTRTKKRKKNSRERPIRRRRANGFQLLLLPSLSFALSLLLSSSSSCSSPRLL